MSKKQMGFIWLLAAGTLLEQIDVYKFSLIAPALQEVWGISVAEVGKVNATFAVGALLGGVVSAWFGDRYGRHKGMTLGLFLSGGGALLTAIAPNYEVLLICRAICGFGIAAALVLEAPYLAEMVPGEHRSRWQGIIGMVALLGIPVSVLVSKLILSTGMENWRFIAAIPGLAIVIGIIFWIRVPESPRWLVAHGRLDEAKVIFKDITGEQLEIDHAQCMQEIKTSYISAIKVMISKKYIKRTVFIITIALVLTNTLNMVTQLLPTLLVNEGLSVQDSLLVQQMLTLVMFCAPLYMIFFGEKGGRKIPYAVVMCIAGISLFAISKAGIDNMPLLYGATLMVGWTIFAHQNFCTVYQAELFPTKVRGMVIGITNIFTKSGTIMTQGLIAPALYGAFGFKGYFLVLAAVYILMSIFILLIAPRTAGLSLEALNECE